MNTTGRKLLNLAAVGLAVSFLLPGAATAAARTQAQAPVQTPAQTQAMFNWDTAGRRDPFIFREARVEPVQQSAIPVTFELPINGDIEPEPTDRPSGTDDPTSAANRERARRNAEALAQRAWERLAAQQFVMAEEHVEQALNEIRQAQLSHPALTERLTRLQATARRMRMRAETERQFRDLRIVIDGIVWQPENPVALINGQLMREGSVVEGAVIRQILPDQVIFELRGVRVRKTP